MSARAESVKEDNVDELDDVDLFAPEEDDNGFTIHDPLQPPSAKLFTTKELHSESYPSPQGLKTCHALYIAALIHQGAVDLNPAYQRGEYDDSFNGTRRPHVDGGQDVVWPTNKQIGLIDSIFRNFYIPPVVFAVQKDEEGEEVRVCVDGKQRLTSIQKFIDGQVSVPRHHISPSPVPLTRVHPTLDTT